MQVHDDYYECYGVENMSIDEIYVGIGKDNGSEQGRIFMEDFQLSGWGKQVTFHERLKKSYYVMQELWTEQTDDKTGGMDTNVGK